MLALGKDYHGFRNNQQLHMSFASLADDEECKEEEPVSLEMKGEGRGVGGLWEKASFPLCVYEGCKVEHRGALLFSSIPTTLLLISIHCTLLLLTAGPLSLPVL